MRDILPDLVKWRNANKKIALATVVETWGSAPRGIGAKMAFTADGALTGSVSGGCVEGAVLEIGSQVLQGGPPRLVDFGVTDETAWDVGLACGGKIRVFIQLLNVNLFQHLHEALEQDRSVVQGIVTSGPKPWIGQEVLYSSDGIMVGTSSHPLDEFLRPHAEAVHNLGLNRHTALEIPDVPGFEEFAGSSMSILFESHSPPPTLIMVGGVHIAIALTSLAKTLGYRTVVIDPRRSFGNAERFSEADLMITSWPDEAFGRVALTESTAVAMLTHDPKIDDPALKIVLPSPVFYVGALGSRKTQKKRRERLLNDGMSQGQVDRIQGPIGLPLGGRSPEEIALAIMAQIIASRHGQLNHKGELK